MSDKIIKVNNLENFSEIWQQWARDPPQGVSRNYERYRFCNIPEVLPEFEFCHKLTQNIYHCLNIQNSITFPPHIANYILNYTTTFLKNPDAFKKRSRKIWLLTSVLVVYAGTKRCLWCCQIADFSTF